MRARMPDEAGSVEHKGVTIAYDVFGDGGPAVLLLPTWTIVHSRFWKLQVPYLARHYRVITYDGPGNGRSDRPLDGKPYHHTAQVDYARAVLDATGIDRAVVVGLSLAANWVLELAATHPERVAGLALIGPTVALAVGDSARTRHLAPLAERPDLPPSAVPRGGQDPPEHWAKYNLEYWRESHEDFLWFFFGQVFNEPHSTKPIEDAHRWGLETTGDVLIAHHHRDAYPDEALVRRWCEQISAPALVVHGDRDEISHVARGRLLAQLLGGRLLEFTGTGHMPMVREPVRVNLALRDFIDGAAR